MKPPNNGDGHQGSDNRNKITQSKQRFKTDKFLIEQYGRGQKMTSDMDKGPAIKHEHSSIRQSAFQNIAHPAIISGNYQIPTHGADLKYPTSA